MLTEEQLEEEREFVGGERMVEMFVDPDYESEFVPIPTYIFDGVESSRRRHAFQFFQCGSVSTSTSYVTRVTRTSSEFTRLDDDD